MHIAELYRNHACLEDLTSELPEGIEYDRPAECLRTTRCLPESAQWGPFYFEIVASPEEAHLSVQTSGSHGQDDVTLFVRLKVKGERWLMLLNFAEDTETLAGSASSSGDDEDGNEEALVPARTSDTSNKCNMAIVVDVARQILYLRALRPLITGARLTARLSEGQPMSCEFVENGPNSGLANGTEAAEATEQPEQSLVDNEDGDDQPLVDNDSDESREEADLMQEVEAEVDTEDAMECPQCGGQHNGRVCPTARRLLLGIPAPPQQLQQRKRPASADPPCPRPLKQHQLHLNHQIAGALPDTMAAAAAVGEVFGSLRYCGNCGLFFTSSWMMEIHRQFHAAFDQPQQLQQNQRPPLVLSAPVLSDRGVEYVPVGLPKITPDVWGQMLPALLPQQHQEAATNNDEAASVSVPPASSSRKSAAAVQDFNSQPHQQQKSVRRTEESTTPLDLTVPRQLEMPAATSALLQTPRHHPPPGLPRAAGMRIPRQALVEQPPHNRKVSTVSSLMSVCKDCKIGFFNYNNYLVHRSLYCQSSRISTLAAAGAAAGGGRSAAVKQVAPATPIPTVQSPAGTATSTASATTGPVPVKEVPPATQSATAGSSIPAESSPTPTAAPAVHHKTPTAIIPPSAVISADRKFQCPYCQIRFHSPSTLSAHQAFYCPENPDKLAASATSSAASAALDANATEISGGEQQPQQQQTQQQQLHHQIHLQSPTWLPILTDSGSTSVGCGGGFKCSICGYIGQTERGMKMHAKVHCTATTVPSSSPTSGNLQPSLLQQAAVAAAAAAAASGDATGGIRLPATFPSELLSNITAEELGMLQHKTQPYSKRRTFKRLGNQHQPHLLHHNHHHHHPGDRHLGSTGRMQVLCVRCGDAFDQLELLQEHQETSCPGAPGVPASGMRAQGSPVAGVLVPGGASIKLESIRQS